MVWTIVGQHATMLLDIGRTLDKLFLKVAPLTDRCESATAGSERAAQGFMLSMQSTTIYCCVGSLCGAPLHGSWVLVVLKRALYKVLSGARPVRRRAPGQLKGRQFAGGGAAAPAAPPGSAPVLSPAVGDCSPMWTQCDCAKTKRLPYIKRSWGERRQKYADDVMYLFLTETPRRLVRRFRIDIQDSPTDGCEVRRRWVQRSLLTLEGEGSKWPVKMGCDEGTKEGCFVEDD